MQAMQVLTALVLLGLGGALSASVPGPREVQPYVAGGEVRENGDLKFMVEITETAVFVSSHSGSGVLLSPTYVLTTSYCVTSSVFGTFYVVVGRSKGAAGTTIDIDQTIKDPTEKLLALLKLKTSVVFNDVIRAVNLPSPYSDIPASGVKGLVAGWGATDKDKNNNRLVAVNVDVRPASECDKNRLCTPAGKTGACVGDDGSPLVQEMKNGVYRLLGIATGTKGVKCPPKKATQYVNIFKHVDWILERIYAA